MRRAFANGFVSELQSCLEKVAGPRVTPGAASAPAPGARPGSPVSPTPGPVPTAHDVHPSHAPPGLRKDAGVASGLERLYLTLGASAAAKDALRYATPRMDAHLVGRDAAKILAGKRSDFGELIGRGRRSATRARQVLDKRADAGHVGPTSSASPFTRTMCLLAENLFAKP